MEKSDQPQTEETFRLAYEFQPSPKPRFWKIVKKECLCTRETLSNMFPIGRWITKYNVKENILSDIIAGVTVAIMHIPHGLAYSQLGGVPPVVGLYMAVFPLIPYVILGTSNHISLGTFAVICAMAGEVVFSTIHSDEISPEDAIPVAACAALVVGLWQILMYILRLQTLTIFLSNSLISGFTTGAAVHVLTYQFKNLLGISVERYTGPLKLIYYYIHIFRKVKDTHLITLIMSLSFFTFLVTYNYGIKPVLKKKFPKLHVALPIELIAIAIGILTSYFLNLNKEYGVIIVAHVPRGLPEPQLPDTSVFMDILLPCFPLAFVAVSINLSLAKIFARKDGYVISSQQEILAYGVMNVFGSFFQCLPVAASLSRSALQHSTGGKTQLASVFSMLLIILILLFMGPVFEPVPYCVLSAIVAATILGLLLQVVDLPKIFRLSVLDGLVWLITFLGVVIIDIDYGLLIGFIASVTSLIIMNHKPQFIELGRVQKGKGIKDLYLDIEHFKAANDVTNLVIIRLIGGMNFSNISHVEHKILKTAKKLEVNHQMQYSGAVVLDFSGVSYVDPSACDGLVVTLRILDGLGLKLFAASLNVKVFSQLERNNFFSHLPPNRIFATVNDAVSYATEFNVISTPEDK